MLIVLKKKIQKKEFDALIGRLTHCGHNYTVFEDGGHRILSVSEDKALLKPDMFADLPGIERLVPVEKPYKLASRDCKAGDTAVKFGKISIGGGSVEVIAGPCSIESEEQTRRIAEKLACLGIKFLRGGAFKPRTSPYSFQGLANEGLDILSRVARDFGMYAVTELLDIRNFDEVAERADIIQVGTRNATNYPLLKELGRQKKPVLLKRGVCSSIKEFLLCAEYIMSQGNERVILCERGIRTFETAYRSTLDITAVSIIKELSHLPIIADPSHASGAWSLVPNLAAAAVAAGADGVMIEVHDRPGEALSDGEQSLKPKRLAGLMKKLAGIAKICGKKFRAGKKAS